MCSEEGLAGQRGREYLRSISADTNRVDVSFKVEVGPGLVTVRVTGARFVVAALSIGP